MVFNPVAAYFDLLVEWRVQLDSSRDKIGLVVLQAPIPARVCRTGGDQIIRRLGDRAYTYSRSKRIQLILS